ncbi:MAG: 4'-phosphopantetheinyl transferase superfamily protein [Niallia nealsonii]|nr:4'-phosphopantetheinyl transferase superfamily protein [Niallia nealsonii]
MVDIYISELPKGSRKILTTHFFSTLPEEYRQKIRSFYKIDDQLRTAIGWKLLNFILINKFQINEQDIVIKTNSYGKPFLYGNSNIHFNISHSGNKVVCVVDKSPVGVDIEQMTKINIDELLPLLTKQEQKIFNNIDSLKKKQSMFYRLWTLKESYLKAKGTGFLESFGPYKIKGSIEDDVVEVEEINTGDSYYCRNLKINNEYALAYCTKSNKAEYTLVTIEDKFFHETKDLKG